MAGYCPARTSYCARTCAAAVCGFGEPRAERADAGPDEGDARPRPGKASVFFADHVRRSPISAEVKNNMEKTVAILGTGLTVLVRSARRCQIVQVPSTGTQKVATGEESHFGERAQRATRNAKVPYYYRSLTFQTWPGSCRLEYAPFSSWLFSPAMSRARTSTRMHVFC